MKCNAVKSNMISYTELIMNKYTATYLHWYQIVVIEMCVLYSSNITWVYFVIDNWKVYIRKQCPVSNNYATEAFYSPKVQEWKCKKW